MLLATKPGKMVTYVDELLPIKSHDSWSLGPARKHDKLKPLYIH